MLNGALNQLRSRIAQSLDWRVAEIKTAIMLDSNERLMQMERQIQQLNSVIANMSISLSDQQRIHALLLEQMHNRLAKIEAKENASH